MRRLFVAATVVVLAVSAVVFWRRNPRVGTGTVNELVNPFLLERGLAGGGRSELGTLEHVGRTTGTVRRTPVHPVITGDAVRIVVPLGLRSQWARNVLAAGGCRLQLHDTVYELDRPVLLPAGAMADLPGISRWLGDFMGFMYLCLRRAGEHPGTLEPAAEQATVLEEAAPSAEPVPTGA